MGLQRCYLCREPLEGPDPEFCSACCRRLRQPGLFDEAQEHPPSRRGAPITSKAAAFQKVGGARAQREKVFSALERLGVHGATAEELADELGLAGDSIRPRLWELRGKNGKRKDLPRRVHDSGRTRPTHAGRGAVVWVCN